MQDCGYNNLLRPPLGLYKVLRFQLHTVAIKENVIQNIVSIYDITLSCKERHYWVNIRNDASNAVMIQNPTVT